LDVDDVVVLITKHRCRDGECWVWSSSTVTVDVGLTPPPTEQEQLWNIVPRISVPANRLAELEQRRFMIQHQIDLALAAGAGPKELDGYGRTLRRIEKDLKQLRY
jgi:hypothetical protein